MSEGEPIKVKLRPVPYYIVGGGLLFFTIICLLVSGMVAWVGDFGTAFWVAFGTSVSFGLPSFWFLGIAIKRPIALRMDENGISGFYADPATWDEIEQINVARDHKGRPMVGFALHDPIGFRDRQTPWRRYKYWANGRAFGHHVILPHMTLKNGEAAKLVVVARDLKAAASR